MCCAHYVNQGCIGPNQVRYPDQDPRHVKAQSEAAAVIVVLSCLLVLVLELLVRIHAADLWYED